MRDGWGRSRPRTVPRPPIPLLTCGHPDALRQNGASVYTISKALGHSSIAVTEAYLAAFDRADAKAEMRSAFGDALR